MVGISLARSLRLRRSAGKQPALWCAHLGGEGAPSHGSVSTPRANALDGELIHCKAFQFPEVFSAKKQGSERASLSEPNLWSTPEVPGTEIGARPPSTMFRLPGKNKIKTL
jgi:hypothetical protein